MTGRMLPTSRQVKCRRAGVAIAVAIAALVATAGAPAEAQADWKLADKTVTDTTGGAQARVELWRRSGDGAVYPKVWVTDTKPDGICAHAAVLWHHDNGNTYPDYGSWVCGHTQRKGPFVWGARNWRDYRSVSLAAFVDGHDPAPVPLYDFHALEPDTRPETRPEGPDGDKPLDTGPSAAGTTKCGRWVAFPGADSWSSYPVRKAYLKGRSVWLRNVRLTDWSYAYIRHGYRRGDRVWIDRSTDEEKRTWFQCGPFSRRHSNQMNNLKGWMRACLDVRVGNGRKHKCTSWYYDDD